MISLRDYGLPAVPAPVENRSYGDVALLRAIQLSGNAGDISPVVAGDLVAHISEAAGVWSRRLALGTFQTHTPIAALNAALLWRAADGLAREGEHVEIIEVVGGAIRLTPAIWFDVEEYDPRDVLNPDGWKYRVNVSAPDNQINKYVLGAGVLHFRLPGPEAWRGQPPLVNAIETRALIGQIERALVDEAGTPSKRIVPMPPFGQAAGQTTADNLRATLLRRRERLLFPETTQANRSQAPQTDWKPQVLKSEPDEQLVKLRRELREQVLSCYGIPPSTIGTSASGQRDADRMTRQAIDAVAMLVSAELTTKLETAIQITFPLAPADLSIAAKSIAVMVDAGITLDEARRIAGAQ